jgi:hypothetical protein
MVPIAAQNLPSAMYTPLVLLLVAYVVLRLLAAREHGRGETAKGEQYETFGFGVVLISALYVVVLLISSLVAYPNRIYDMVITFLVVGIFFGILLFVFFFLAEVLPGRFRRSGDGR